MKLVFWILLPTSRVVGGCHNSCQQICSKMRKYAEECGISVSQDELSACFERQAGSESKPDRPICREYGDLDTIKQEWSCEDVEDYWMADAPDTEDSPAEDGN